MPSPCLPLSQSDIAAQPAREVAYYGSVRQGFEQARSGLEAVIQHLSGLLQKNPDNVRLERYLAQLNKLLAKLHKLQMRSSRVRDQRVERAKPKQPSGDFLHPGGDSDAWHENAEDIEHREKLDMMQDHVDKKRKPFNSGKMPWPPEENP